MHVLICDDDSATRFILRRMLTQSFPCDIHECQNGVEALDLMARQHFSFVLLDIEMPGMDGYQTLEEIRASETIQHTPVIILSRERDERQIGRLVELGIADYILKPPRPETVSSKVGRLLRTLPPAAQAAVDTRNIRLSPTTPALIAEGNLDYRFFFTSQIEKYGPVAHAGSGAAALSAFQQSPCDLVFIGDDLGVVTPDRLARRIRERRPGGVRIIRLVNSDDETVDTSLFDGALRRSYVPDAFKAAVRSFIAIPGPLNAVTTVVPELTAMVVSATQQVFGMMLGETLQEGSSAPGPTTPFTSALDMVLGDRFDLVLAVHLSERAARTITSRMFGAPPEEMTPEDCLSTSGELGNLLSGRLHANFRERSLSSVMGLPRLTPDGPVLPVNETNGFLHAFAIPDGGDFWVGLSVADRLHVGGAAPAGSRTDAADAGATAGAA